MPRAKLELRQSLYAVAMLATTGFGYAVAQDEPAAEEPVADESAELDVASNANLTPEQQLEQARNIQERGQGLSRRVSGMLDEARQERDIVRVTCVNDKLTQVNANLRTVDERLANLEDAVEADDAERRSHEFIVIGVLGQKFVVLDRESAQCIGQDIFETGSTRVVTEVDPETPTENPTVLGPIWVPFVPFVPPPGSGDL